MNMYSSIGSPKRLPIILSDEKLQIPNLTDNWSQMIPMIKRMNNAIPRFLKLILSRKIYKRNKEGIIAKIDIKIIYSNPLINN